MSTNIRMATTIHRKMANVATADIRMTTGTSKRMAFEAK